MPGWRNWQTRAFKGRMWRHVWVQVPLPAPLLWADSSAVERLPYTQEVRGSNPLSPTSFAEVAQSVEQGTENPRVGGSIPSLGTTFWNPGGEK